MRRPGTALPSEDTRSPAPSPGGCPRTGPGILGSEPVRTLFGLGPDESLLGWVNIGPPAPLGRKGLRATDDGEPVRVLRIED